MAHVRRKSPTTFSSKGNWTLEQLKLAFHFYCQTPFGKLHSKNPQIVELAKLIGCTPNALAMKLVNFASFDPSVTSTGRTGLGNASVLDRKVWDEFHADWERLTSECEQLQARLVRERGLKLPRAQEEDADFALADFSGETREAIVRQRVKQCFFRHAVLASYRGRCCISGVSERRLLVASHIVPWSKDKSNRLNPSNGLCLSAIHDKAFDNYLFSLTDDLRILLSTELRATKDRFLREVFWQIEERQIELPERFAPDPRFIQKHRRRMFSAEQWRKAAGMSSALIPEDEFEAIWRPYQRSSGDLLYYESICDQSVHYVWTIVEIGDDNDGSWYAQPGFHIVNELGYVMTKKPWTDSTCDAIYFLDDFGTDEKSD